MTATRIRWLEKFTRSDGVEEYVFPRYNFESSHSQGLTSAYMSVVGADYQIDQLSGLSLPKQNGQEVARFALYADNPTDLNTAYDTVRATLYRWGLGKLWSYDGATRRWCWARINDIPSVTIKRDNFVFLPVVCNFVRTSDWYDETAVDQTENVTFQPYSFTVTNSGSLEVMNIVFRFMANSSSGINSPILTNLTTGESFRSTYVSSSADSELRVDTGRFAVESSENNGGAYSNAYDTFVMGNLQVGFMRLLPGDNALQYTQGTGVPNLDLEVTFNPAYAS